MAGPSARADGLLADRLLVAAAVVLTAVLFVPDALDPVNIVKLAALLVCTVAVGALAVARVARTRVATVPTGAPAVVAVALLLALVVAAVVAPHTPTAVYGTYGRNSGLLAYGAAVLLLLASLRLFDRGSARVLAFAVLLAGLFTATYGLLQKLGVDAVPWNNPFDPIIAAMGNPDFASGYLGIAVPVALWAALWSGWSPVWRGLSLLTAVLCFGVAAASSAVQGPLAGAAGATVVLVAWLLDQRDPLRRLALAALAALAALGAAALVAGSLGAGPASSFFAGISFRARTWYWQAALSMFGDSPVWGVGLDSYGIRWRQERPLDVARELGGDHFSDAAHNVPLQMLAQGGLLLGGAYLALVALVAWHLVRGLVRLRGQDRLLLAGLGGAWAAYQVQSTVSIDQVPLLVAHLVLAAGVLVTAGAVRLREVRLPGAAPVQAPPAQPRRRAAPAVPRQRTPAAVDHAVVSLAVVAGLVLAFLSLTPLRASRAAFAGDGALSSGNGDQALASYDRATDLMPSTAVYWSRIGSLFNQAQQPDRALEAYLKAAEVDPFDVGALRTAGRIAQAAGDLQQAERLFARAVQLDPTNSATVLDLTRLQVQHDGAGRALPLLERATAALPRDAALWAALGDARAALQDRSGAEQAYRRALELQPGEPGATAGLQRLGG